MENVSFNLSDVQYLLFIIPGFVVVWTYRFFSKPKPIGEFEYAGLSFIWGIILVASTGFILKYLPDQELFNKSPYNYTFWLSFFGLIFGWLGSFVARSKWLKKLIDFLRPENFKI